MRHAEKARQPRRAVGRVARVGREPHKRRHRPIHRPEHLRSHRADARPSALRLVADRATGVADERIMIAARRAVDAPQHDALVHDPRHPRHMLADLQARDVRVDRPKLAADLRRRVHLHVVHVLMRRRTAHVDHDHRLVRRADARLLLGLEQLWQRQAAQGEAADAKHVAAADAIAECRAAVWTAAQLRIGHDRKHGWGPDGGNGESPRNISLNARLLR